MLQLKGLRRMSLQVLQINDLGEYAARPRLASSKSRGIVAQPLMEVKRILQG